MPNTEYEPDAMYNKAAEQARGPTRPAPSHSQIKTVEQTLREVWFWAQRLNETGPRTTYLAPTSRYEGMAREAMLNEAARSIFDAFGMEPLQVKR